MSNYKKQSVHVTNITESIYTISITAKENKLRSNMRILREMFRNKRVDPSTWSYECLSNCLWFAVLDQDAASVQGLMKYNPDVNLIRCDINMVWMSIIRNNMEIAKYLVEAGADVNVRIPDGGPSFLHFLVTMGDDKDCLELAKLMIEKGADVNAYSAKFSVLQTAIIHEAVPFVEILLKNGATFMGIDIILLATRCSKSSELLPMLVNNIVNVDDRLARIFKALQYLIEEDFSDLDQMKALLKLDLPVFYMDIDGWTLLRTAVSFNKIQVVQLLLDYSVDVKQRTGSESSPLLWIASGKALNESHKLIVKHLATLVSNDARVNDGDLEQISDCPIMSAYYKECLLDLQKK